MSVVYEAVPHHAGTDLPFLLTTKLHAPEVRDQTIPRVRLKQRLHEGARCKLTLIACPPGFGKTTLLARWCHTEAPQRPVAWVTIDEGDNDPVVLWSYVIEALRRACPNIGQTSTLDTFGADRLLDVVLPRLVNRLEEEEGSILILDDFHWLSSGLAAESVAWFIEHAPSTCRIVLVSRSEPALPLARLRAYGELLELRAEDLRFTFQEADAFLNGSLELDLDRDEVEVLVERTEGWPAGLYLAALSLRRGVDSHEFVHRFGATNRQIVDFLGEEVIAAHDPALQTFMFRASTLDRLSGPLCDAVLETQDSAGTLDALSRTNLFLVPLDDRGEWYRFHHLFAELLRRELRRREPELVPTLHRRSFVWHRDHGTTDEAIDHAIEAGMFAEAAEMIEASWPDYINSSRHFTVLAWLRRFPEGVLHGDARLLLVQAWVLSLCSQPDEAARAIAAIERLGANADGPLPDGFLSVASSLAVLQAVFTWGDAGAHLTHGLRAAELEGPEARFRPVACWAVGMGHFFQGRYDEASPWFEEVSARENEQWLVAVSALAYRSMIAGKQGRFEEQQQLAEQAMELTRERSIEDVDGEAPLALGLSLVARRRIEEALPLFERAVAVLRSFGQPLDLAHALLQHAAVLQLLGQRERSGLVAAEVRAMLDTCPDPGILRQRLDALTPEPSTRLQSTALDNLTEAELRVLRLLNSGLSEREMGQELYLSHNTVHSHVRAIYQKFGVSSRAQALEMAESRGLLRRSPAQDRFNPSESGAT